MVREAIIARLPAFAFAASSTVTMPSAFFWFGQMTSQTLRNMMMPSHMPTPITR
ncbi:hypothetical protein D3C83_309430 [compost metagenome]